MTDIGKDIPAIPQNITEGKPLSPTQSTNTQEDIAQVSSAQSLRDLLGTSYTGEARLDSETVARFGSVIDAVQYMLIEAHGLEDEQIPNIEQSLWTGTNEELKRVTGMQELPLKGANIVGKVNGTELMGTIVYFPPDLVARVVNTDHQELFTNAQYFDDIATAIEETSHFVYTSFYQKKFGGLPNEGIIELVGALDRYNITKYLSKVMRDEKLSEGEYQAAVLKNEAAFFLKDRGKRNPAHIIGHELGVQYLQVLDHMRDTGQDAGQEFGNFYKSPNTEQVRHLFTDLGLQVQTYSDEEKVGLKDLLAPIVSVK